MSLVDNSLGVADLAALSGNGINGNDGLIFWLLIIFLFSMNGGWGGGFGGADTLYPWMNNSQNINDGFRDQMINGNIQNIQNGITAGFGNVQNSLCAGFAGVNATVNNAQNAIVQQMYANQLSDLNRSFDAQVATTNGFTNLQAQLAQCCCNNNLASVETRNVVQQEGAATRLAIQNQTQQILDKMCQQEIDNLKAQNIALQNQVNMLNLATSQTAQTLDLKADNALQTQLIINKLPTTVAAAG